MTKITKGQDGRRAYSWIVKITVSETWVEDGFDLDDERARDMIAKDLQYAFGEEYDAKVMDWPSARSIARAQGAPPARKKK